MRELSTYNYTIDQQDIDLMQRASLTSIIGHLLSSAGKDASSRGWGVDTIVGENHTWVLSRLSIEIISLPTLGDKIAIDTWVNSLERILSTRNFTIRDNNGEVIAHATSKWCMLDLSTRTPINLSIIGMLSIDKPSTIDPPHRIDTSRTQSVAQHRVAYSDIDFNRHVNTLRYIEMMLDSTPLDHLANSHGVRADIHFVSESKIGELLDIKRCEEEGVYRFEIAHEDSRAAIKAQFSYR